MQRRSIVVVATVLVALATGCWQGHDFDNDHLADFIVIDLGTSPTDPSAYRRWDDGSVLSESPSGPAWPVPEDYDGDGAFDPAWVDSHTGEWITNSPAGDVTFLPTGGLACADYRLRAVPADYDGDHRADPAWYCGATGTWSILGRAPVVFGDPLTGEPAAGEDIAVPADYDGDDHVDLAVFNLRTLEWRVWASATDTISSVTMTGNEALPVPVPGDYLGLGHAQRATVGPDGWIVDGLDDPIPYPGAAGDAPAIFDGSWPAPADYDGDNIIDLSVWYGDWEVLHSKDVSPGGTGESEPWDQLDPELAYAEIRSWPSFPGDWGAPVQSTGIVMNTSLISYHGACNADPFGC